MQWSQGSYITQIYYTNKNLNLLLCYTFTIYISYQVSDVIAKRVIFLVINKPLVSGTLSWRQWSITLRCQMWWWPTSHWCPNTEGIAETDSFSNYRLFMLFFMVFFSLSLVGPWFSRLEPGLCFIQSYHIVKPTVSYSLFSFPNATSNAIKRLSSSLGNTI